MTHGEVERRLAAILAADVVGYSRLVGEDEEGTIGLDLAKTIFQVHGVDVSGETVMHRQPRRRPVCSHILRPTDAGGTRLDFFGYSTANAERIRRKSKINKFRAKEMNWHRIHSV